MGKDKLIRFAVIAERRNVIEPGKEIFTTIKGKWREFFGNDNDIVVELGCGRGEYTTGMAAVFPDKNFIGIDIKGARIWKGSTVAFENNLNNAAFLRIRTYQLFDLFEEGEVNDVWMTFPDPRMKEKDEKQRMTNIRHLEIYKRLLSKGGTFRLKTDCFPLFEYTCEVIEKNPGLHISDIESTTDLYNSSLLAEHYGIQTTYETRFLNEGFKINYLKFKFN